MKKLIVHLIFNFAIVLSVCALKTEVDTYQIPKDQKERIVLENEIGKAEILNPELLSQLENCKVVAVTYVHSAYAPHGFDQSILDKRRKENLESLIDLSLEKIKWHEVSQTSCQNSTCAKTLLHGFVIDFVPKSTFHYGRIDKQRFICDVSKGRRIEGTQGTTIQIKPNSFVYADGTKVKGNVQIELREALNFENIVKGNLLTITDKGDLLQTGGMIQVQAFSNGKNVHLEEGAGLDVSIPKTNEKEGMKFYAGELQDGVVVWNNPSDLGIEQEDDEVNFAMDIVENNNDSISPWTWGFTATWTGVEGNIKGKKITLFGLERNANIKSIRIGINEKTFVFRPANYTAEKGMNAGLDWDQAHVLKSYFERKDVIRPSEISEYFNPSQPLNDIGWNWFKTIEIASDTEGVNSGSLDDDLSYLFSMKKLGWGNIDRLAMFPETFKGNLEVSLRNFSDTAFASIALVIPSADIYIPGYKMKKGNYAFTHGDYERNVPLPKNKEAYIIATYNAEGKDYFGTKKFTIGSHEIETLSMLQKDKSVALKEIERLF
ncbi:MAG: hypothetical protein AAF487_01875 [Bacteroidota bacterium]